jgi:cell division protein FtsW (lipid II flippase)
VRHNNAAVTKCAVLCGAISVALGAIYMFAADAPRLYLIVNAAAFAVGTIAALLMRQASPPRGRSADAVIIAAGLVLVVTALFGVHVDGATRWIRLAGQSVQPGLILLPLTMMLFAQNRSWGASIGLAVAAVGLGMQPDRAMAGTLVAGLAALYGYRREPPVIFALTAGVAAFVTTLLRSDVVPPVLFVEQVVRSAFVFHALTGLAVVAGVATMLVPAAVGVRAANTGRELSAVFGATWLAVIVFALIGNYPTPLVGYGSSAILGYCLSAGAFQDRLPTARRKGTRWEDARSVVVSAGR